MPPTIVNIQKNLYMNSTNMIHAALIHFFNRSRNRKR